MITAEKASRIAADAGNKNLKYIDGYIRRAADNGHYIVSIIMDKYLNPQEKIDICLILTKRGFSANWSEDLLTIYWSRGDN